MNLEIRIWIGIFLLLTSSTVGAGEIGIISNPPTPIVGEMLTATVLNNGAPVPRILVSFAIDGGIPVFNMTNSQGVAIYKPLVTGKLVIKATLDGTLLANTSTTVITPPTRSSSPSSGGGGGGGGGGPSGESYPNVLMREMYEEEIYKDRTTTYKFKDERNPIVSVAITGNLNAGLIATTVEVLKNTSTLVKANPPGKIYKNVNIWAGTSGFSSSRNIKGITINFRILNSWLLEKKIAGKDIKMAKWDGAKWVIQDTKERSKDDEYTYFEVDELTLSPHAIIAERGATAISFPETTKTDSVNVPKSPGSSTPTKPISKIPGFEYIVGMAAIVGVYIALRKK